MEYKSHAELLRKALEALLGTGQQGSVAFVRCLPRSVIEGLCAEPTFNVQDWKVFGVVGESFPERRLITADRAVELREDKGDALLLLVDVESAGAGMDGIYSAAREIAERILFDAANKLALRGVPRAARKFVAEAVKRARRVGERNTISPWREFNFYTECHADSASVGGLVSRVGLWPIRIGPDGPDLADLDVSARMVERLLLGSGAGRTAAARIDSLMLVEPTESQRKDLEQVIREAGALPLDRALVLVAEQPDVWLHAIEPGFTSGQLQRIRLRSWRTMNGRIAKWSGLIDGGDNLPQFVIDPDAESPAQYSKLEIRWDTEPDEIPSGTIEYRIAILSGDDELASRDVTHSGRLPQIVRFTNEDFQDLDEDSKFEARVVVTAVGMEGVTPCESEEFLLLFGSPPERAHAGSGTKVRTLVEGAISVSDKEEFVLACAKTAECTEDRRGYITYRPAGQKGRSFRVYRPALIRAVEEHWAAVPDSIGRWSLRVRADGTRVGELAFHEIQAASCPQELWDRLQRSSRRLCEESLKGLGLLGRIHCGAKASEEYVNAWAAALDQSEPSLALAHTIEVQNLAGRTLGLVVLPSHPIRVAWHMAYDSLAQYARYEQGMSHPEVVKTLASLDSSHFPSMLPGLATGTSFVFGDTLGFHTVIMIPDNDREPKAAIAQIARCLAGTMEDAAPSVGLQTATVLAKEVRKYRDYHRHNQLLHIHSLRPGDGSTIARALGAALAEGEPIEDLSEDSMEPSTRPCYSLNLFSADQESDVTGRFLADVAEKRRSGSGGVLAEDRWMLESIALPGGITLPRLQWYRRPETTPQEAAHLAVAFDTFVSTVDTTSIDEVNAARPLHAFGLAAHIERRCTFLPNPQWQTFIGPQVEGQRHPAGRPLTDRLLRLQAALLRVTARNLSDQLDRWPILRTELSAEHQEDLAQLHRLSDWVITVDRNAGVEYFDSPREARAIYDAYVIDCVPERNDLGCFQLITSTSKTEEVRDLLDDTLAQMGLSSSLRNCEFLLWHLKAISGRLAIRLVSPATKSGELIALALVHANCVHSSDEGTGKWLNASQGFFVPLDDVRDLLPIVDSASDEEGAIRPDLLFVTAPVRGGLGLSFVEVKYRRHLAMARDPELLDTVVRQADTGASRWIDWYFDPNLPEVTCTLRRSRLVRVLRFYADKALRHHLDSEVHARLVREIDKLLLQGTEYKLSVAEQPNRGYIFCPEMVEAEPVAVAVPGDSATQVFLFGPGQLPDLASRSLPSPEPQSTPSASTPADAGEDHEPGPDLAPVGGDVTCTSASDKVAPGSVQPATGLSPSIGTTAVEVYLGDDTLQQTRVTWELSIKANPHMMIVGLPGMGKTTCLINLCKQLSDQQITPIIFSYHQDIDERLRDKVANVALMGHDELGFDPTRIDTPTPSSHIDSAGMLRDIIAAIFPDLGDVQLERVRQAIKESYLALGWGKTSPTTGDGGQGHVAPMLQTPEFRAFYEVLCRDAKPDKGLMARLTELDDYGVFSSRAGGSGLLESRQLSVLRIHLTQNEVVQRAFASLMLYSLYKEMFRRGIQASLTHAVIFDEAHRASKLKLLPTMAKECRKYGIALIVASQEAKDFDTSLYSAIANYLVLRLTENDARALAKNITVSDAERRTADRIKMLDKYQALFFREGKRRPSQVILAPE